MPDAENLCFSGPPETRPQPVTGWEAGPGDNEPEAPGPWESYSLATLTIFLDEA